MNFTTGVIAGQIEVICGPMFSGKTTELIRRVTRAQIARQKVQVFKPALDTRYSEEEVVSHSDDKVDAVPLNRALEVFGHLYNSTRVVAFDEVQFFDDEIVSVIGKLAQRGQRVICAGLDLDYRGRPFGPIPELLAIADKIDKIHAICVVCGAPATRTQRLTAEDTEIVLGETDKYEARCRGHYDFFDSKLELNYLKPDTSFDMDLDSPPN